jgi:hypothetical protein
MKTSRLIAAAGLLGLTGLTAAGCERRSETSRDDTSRTPETRGEALRDDARRADQRTPSVIEPRVPPTPNEPSGTLEPGRTDPGSAALEPRRGNEKAVSSITQARCDRETRCNNVGAGKKFESRAECVEKTRNDWREDLNALECPRGVVEQELASCVTQIKTESCANPFDRLGSSIACRSTDLCSS